MDKTYKTLPNEKLKEFIDVAAKNAICAFQNCNAELMNLNKIKAKRDEDFSILIKKLQDKTITQKKYEEEMQKINSKFLKTEQSFKYMECSLKNCFEFMKKQLLITVDTKIAKFNNNEAKMKKLEVYKNLFNQTTINMKDIRKFYKEFM
jgi:hypothetical protein